MLSDHLLGLFFSDEQNYIYQKLEISDLSSSEREQLKVLAFRFLGPLFFSAATKTEKNWRFELIECGLLLDPKNIKLRNFFQSLFVINSSLESHDILTNLCAIIASVYTEDIQIIQEKMRNYIHPSILQGKRTREHIQGNKFDFTEFVESEIQRGIVNLRDTLGQARKAHWKLSEKYYLVGIVERKGTLHNKNTTLYTFDQEDPLRKQIKKYIPSYYICAILPNYYEHRIIETLSIFKREQVIPIINKIQLNSPYGQSLYIEDYISEGNEIYSLGLILISENEFTDKTKKISLYKRKLREILLTKDETEKKRIMARLNPNVNPFKKWNANNSEELSLIQKFLDER